MSTGLVAGLSLDDAVHAVREKAVERLAAAGGKGLGLWSESGRSAVMVGIAMEGKGAFVMTIPHEEYCGMKLLNILTGMCFDGPLPKDPLVKPERKRGRR